MSNNKKLRIAALVPGASAAVMSALSFAQRGGCWGDGPMGGPMPEGRHADRMKMHQQRLHDALKLTPQQEGAWSKFQESHPLAGNAKAPDPVDFSQADRPGTRREDAGNAEAASGSHEPACRRHEGLLRPADAGAEENLRRADPDGQAWPAWRHARPRPARPGQPAGGQLIPIRADKPEGRCSPHRPFCMLPGATRCYASLRCRTGVAGAEFRVLDLSHCPASCSHSTRRQFPTRLVLAASLIALSGCAGFGSKPA